MRLVAPRLASSRLVSPCLARSSLVSRGLSGLRLVSPGLAWSPVISPGLARSCAPLGAGAVSSLLPCKGLPPDGEEDASGERACGEDPQGVREKGRRRRGQRSRWDGHHALRQGRPLPRVPTAHVTGKAPGSRSRLTVNVGAGPEVLRAPVTSTPTATA